ncbi:MAG: hypothetical protein O3C41_00655 [Bacteroidetes bacterium]|nr:hypothetical protein [Bacteroidota bacterium]
MNRKISFIFLVLFTQHTFSQGIQFADGTSTKMDNTFLTLSESEDPNIEGSKYLNDNFSRASLSSMPNQIYAVRYNVFGDEMEFRGKDNNVLALNKSDRSVTVRFLDTNKTYFLFEYLNEDKLAKVGYFTKLNPQGDNIILKKNVTIFLKEKESKTGYDPYRPPMYKKVKDRIYIKLKGEMPVLLSSNKKKLASLFPGKEKEIGNFINKNRINLKKEIDLIKLINYLNK